MTSRIALRDIPGELYLTCMWYTPVLKNGETVLTAQHYDLLPQNVTDLTTQVNAKYIVSVVELQQEVKHYCLSGSNDHLLTLKKQPLLLLQPDVTEIKRKDN